MFFSRAIQVAVAACLLSLPCIQRIEAQTGKGAAIEISSGHSSSIRNLAFAPDGSWFATSSSHEIKLWDVATGRLLRTLVGHSDDVLSLDVSSDGRLLASTSSDRTVKIWNTETGEQLRSRTRSLRGSVHLDMATQTLILRDARTAITLFDEVIARWDVRSGTELKAFEIQNIVRQPDRRPRGSTAAQMALSPDEKFIVVGFHRETKLDADSEADAQIVIWDTQSGRLVSKIAAHQDDIKSVAVSPNGEWIASLSMSGPGRPYTWQVKLWEFKTGRLLRTFGGVDEDEYVPRVAFSADSRWLSYAPGAQLVRIWNARTGEPQPTIQLDRADGRLHGAFAFSPKPGLAAAGSGKAVRLLDPASGQLVRIVPENSSSTDHVYVAATPDNRWVKQGPAGLAIWNSSSGQPDDVFQSYNGDRAIPVSWRSTGSANTISINERGHWTLPALVRSDAGYAVGWWDINESRLLPSLYRSTVADESVSDLMGAPDGSFIVMRNGVFSSAPPDQKKRALEIKLIQTGNGKVTAICEADALLYEPQLSPDRKTIAIRGSARGKKQVRFCDVATGRKLREVTVHEMHGFSFAVDGRSVFVDGWNEKVEGELKRIDIASGRMLWKSRHPSGEFNYHVVASPNGKWVATAPYRNTATVWDAASGIRLKNLEGNAGIIKSLAFSPDSRRLAIGNSNGTSTIWSPDSGELLATTVQGKSGEWLTITPEGFFVASENGAGLLHVVQGMRTTAIDQVYQSLYRPDLVREKLAGDPRRLVRQAAASLDLSKVIASGNAPEVSLSLPGRALGPVSVDARTVTAAAEISDRGGGIGRIEWRVNGVTAGIDNASAAVAGQPLRLTREVALDQGVNEIAVVAYNGANLIASVPSRVSITMVQPPPVPGPPSTPGAGPVPAPAVAARPRLFVLAAGVNDYAERRIKLSYAVPDARAVASGFEKAAGRLYESVVVKLITDAEVTGGQLDRAFAEMAGQMQASDVFILYLAGHGKTVDGRYYFIPQDLVVNGEMSGSNVETAVRTKGIAQEQLQRWFASIPARKSVILFDTCDSGTLTGDAAETQQLERGAANDRLARATGRSIITASGGSEEALEGYRGHGLFTYQMLDALYQADGDNNGTVEVTELAAYVYAQVTELSLKIFKQRQAPQMKITSNYALAVQTRVLQGEGVPMAQAKPAYQVAQAASLQIMPGSGATVVRSLAANTPITIIESRNGWSLVASEGRPLGYVATRDLAPAR